MRILINYIVAYIIKVILYIAYIILYIKYKDKTDDIVDPPHLIPSPGNPIDSHTLALALNPNTLINKLIKYSKHPDPFIRCAVCRNPSLPNHELIRLLDDQNSMVSDEAKRVLNKNKIHRTEKIDDTPSEIIEIQTISSSDEVGIEGLDKPTIN